MGYDSEIYRLASSAVKERRKRAEEAAASKLEDFYALCPEAKTVKAETASTAAKLAKAIFSGSAAREKLCEIKERNLSLQKKFAELAVAHGFSPQDFIPAYSCPLCSDTGFRDGRMCTCLIDEQKKLAFERLGSYAPIKDSTFENFSLEYYRSGEQEYEQMKRIYDFCREYAAGFTKHSSSLLFKGGTGLGKTHLSLAIAGAVLEKGFGTVYSSAQNIASSFEKDRFEHEDAGLISTLSSCDLLIIDDLGMEFNSSYVVAALFNLINSRLLADVPTIISTNLTFRELEARYGERFSSRLAGCYSLFQFLGTDIRYQKRSRKKQ